MRRLLVLVSLMLLIAACGGGDEDNVTVVSNQPTVRNFPTTAPTSSVPTASPSPTNSFGLVNPVSGCPIQNGWQAYEVTFGDTLGVIAESIGSTVEIIQGGNCLSSETIYIDQLLFLPSLPLGVPTVDAQLYTGSSTGTGSDTTGGLFVPTATPAVSIPISCSVPPGWVAYAVQAGDTLGDLATRTTTTVGNLQNGNCLTGELIYIGQVLYLPRVPDSVVINPSTGSTLLTPTVNTTCAVPAGWIPYTVRAGDTLGVLATAYSTTIAVLQNGNCLTSAELIYIGQVLYVPSGTTIVVTTAPTLTPPVGSTLAPTTTPATTGGLPPALPTPTVRPTLVRQDGVLVTLQRDIALDVGVVADADRVIYYARIGPTDPAPVQIAVDTDPFDGTQITYTFSTFDSELYFSAEAQNEFGVSTSQLVRVVYDPSYAIGSGPPDITPFLGFDGAIYTLQQSATVSISWQNFPSNASRVDFLLVQGTQSSIIGSDTNLSDGARITWVVTGPLIGQLYALATTPGGQTIESSRVSVFVQDS